MIHYPTLLLDIKPPMLFLEPGEQIGGDPDPGLPESGTGQESPPFRCTDLDTICYCR
jgi:hypothetical protein